MIDILVSVITCIMAGCALGYCEVRGWAGVTRVVTYAGVSLMVAELGAEPLLWQLLQIRGGWVETPAMALALGAALWVGVSEGQRWV